MKAAHDGTDHRNAAQSRGEARPGPDGRSFAVVDRSTPVRLAATDSGDGWCDRTEQTGLLI